MKLFTFTLKFDCDKCGEMIAVNGPARTSTCSSCQKQQALTPSRWGETICTSRRGYSTMDDVYRCKGYETREPRCPKCDKHFPFDETVVGQDTQIHCPHCGLAITTFPAPDWLKQELPAVVQLVGADREGPESGGVSLDTNEQASRPVMLNCPNCAAPLRITAEAERTIICEHCGVDVYLPDGVWKRLHPVHTVHPWSIVYQGKLETAVAIYERRCKQSYEEREGKRMRRISERNRRRREEEKKRNLRNGALIVGAGIILFGTFLYFQLNY